MERNGIGGVVDTFIIVTHMRFELKIDLLTVLKMYWLQQWNYGLLPYRNFASQDRNTFSFVMYPFDV